MAARNRYRRRTRQTGPAGLVLGLVFIVAVIFLVRTVFVVKRVSVSGNETISDDRIRQMSGILLGDSIFSIDRAAVAAGFEREGALALVQVDVAWPGDVRLVVRERVRAAVIDHLGLSVVIDEWGAVIEVQGALPNGDLPVVTGMSVTGYQPGQTITSSVYGQVEAMVAVLNSIRAGRHGALVSELNVSNLDNLYLMTRSGIMVKLGDQLNMDAKLIIMQSVLAQLDGGGRPGDTLDVSSGKDGILRSGPS